MHIDNEAAIAGSVVYNPFTLSIYDTSVLWFSNTFVWKCPTPRILDFYNQHVGVHHLDVGVGSGYFLDRCQFPTPTPALTIVDLNATSLRMTAKRIRRYQPTTVRANILEPLPLTSTFDSVGINYLLHCLPGTMESKAIVFENLKSVLNKGGVVFGTTVLGKGVRHNALARSFLRTYNVKGFFSNMQDSQAALEQALSQHFGEYNVYVVGCVAFFYGRI